MSRAARAPHPSRVRILLALALALLVPTSVAAQEPIARQRVVGLVNPIGAEHAIALGIRAPLGLPDELLFQDSHVELGAVSYASPIYARTGGYLELQPLALLVLRAEVRQVAMWALPLPGAGYVPLGANEEPGDAGEARGWEVELSVALQGMVPLGPLRLLFRDQLGYERIALGPAERYLSPRHDAALAREDGVLANAALMLLEIPLAEDLALRIGAYDDLSLVPQSDALTHQVGALAALTIERPAPPLVELTPLVRAGVYTDGRRAGELTVLAGALLTWR